eukprot:g1109.t1
MAWFILALLVAIAVYAIFLYNALVKKRQMVAEGWSGIDVQLKRRANLIPNLVETVKGYTSHENETLTSLTELRAQVGALPAEDVAARAMKESALSQALGRLFAVAEAYPDLKASQNFSELHQSLDEIENAIQMARRYYNGAVRNLNVAVESVPSNLIATEERILKYVSDIGVSRNGDLTVTETITVRAEGDQIKRGIFRDIPLTARNASGHTYRVGFKLLSVLQDGNPAPHFYNESGAGVRVYIGEESTYLTPGVYTYTIAYQTDRQIRFFSDHDEVYWSATGNEWAFPIDEAVARVRLPDGVKATEWTAYTGRFGSTDQNYTANSSDDGSEVIFTTTQPLWAEEGLTVVVSMPVGSVARPAGMEKLVQTLKDYRTEIVGGFGVLFVLAYYLFAWWRVGRDPAKGVVFPRFKPPSNVSPALARYIDQRGFGDGGWIALTAACLNLAVKKRLQLQEEDGDMTISLASEGRGGSAPGEGLPKGEAALERWLDKRGSPLTLNKANGKSIQTLGDTFTGAITSENHNVFFKSNGIYLVPGILASLVTLVALFFVAPLVTSEQEFMIMFLFLSVFATVFPTVFGLLMLPVSSFLIRLFIVMVIIGLALFGAAQLAGLATGGLATLAAVPFVLAGLVYINLLAIAFIGAPTMRAMVGDFRGLAGNRRRGRRSNELSPELVRGQVI